MPVDNLTLNYAENHVSMYESSAGTDVMQNHHEAMDCMNCEAFIKLGIEAFHWLVKADTLIRQEILDDDSDMDFDEMEKCIQTLAVRWLGPCQVANEWIDTQIRRGFTVDNLEEFRQCETEMRSIVDFFQADSDNLTTPIKAQQDRAIEEHNNGATAEFV